MSNEQKHKGYIYIFTNPSFPEYVKIGYATDVNKRLGELNSSTAVPFAFRVYATYEVDSNLSDKKLHSILDKLNTDLRSREEYEGKNRVREFYAMTPDDAYSILEAIAEINNYKDRLKRWKATKSEQADENAAKEISEVHRERLAPFKFSMCGISVGEEIEFWPNTKKSSGIFCTVVDDNHIEYDGTTWSLTGFAKNQIGTNRAMSGPHFFKFKGEWLNDIRKRMEK